MKLKNPQGSKHYSKFKEHVGCSYEQLVEHLESQFVEGMTWENYGLRGWHIDHIKPVCSFDHTDTDEVRECWHYSNLQPLWAIDNWKKGGR